VGTHGEGSHPFMGSEDGLIKPPSLTMQCGLISCFVPGQVLFDAFLNLLGKYSDFSFFNAPLVRKI
jgi:hypothetical protein